MSAAHPVQEGLRRRSANVNSLWFLPNSLLIKKSPQGHSHPSPPQAFCYGDRVSSLPSTPFPDKQWWYHPACASLWELTVLISSQLCIHCPPIDRLISATAVLTLQDSAMLRVKASIPQAGSPACPCWRATLLHRPTHPGPPRSHEGGRRLDTVGNVGRKARFLHTKQSFLTGCVGPVPAHW